MKVWHFFFAAVVIGLCEFCGCRVRRLARRFHII